MSFDRTLSFNSTKLKNCHIDLIRLKKEQLDQNIAIHSLHHNSPNYYSKLQDRNSFHFVVLVVEEQHCYYCYCGHYCYLNCDEIQNTKFQLLQLQQPQ